MIIMMREILILSGKAGRGRRIIIRSKYGSYGTISQGAPDPFGSVFVRNHVGVHEPQYVRDRFLRCDIARSTGSAVPRRTNRSSTMPTGKLCR